MSKSEYDLDEDAARYVVEALAAVRAQDPKRTVDSLELASNWVLPRPSNYIEMRAEYAEQMDEKRSEVSEDSVKEWLIEQAIGDVNANNGGDYNDVILDDPDGPWRLDESVDIATLQLRGEPLLRKSLPNLFGPEGLWRENIRAIDFDPEKDKDDRELLDSMRENGWMKQWPAELDEHGVWLTGHRRKAAADILGIEYHTHVTTYGDGEAGEAIRAQVSLNSNIGVKKYTPADRAKIARDLYTSDTVKWTTTGIAKLLNVSAMTISRDLSGFNNVKPPPERGGRPHKGDKGSQPEPAPEPVPAPPTLTVVPEPEPEPEPEQPSPSEEPPVGVDAEVVNPGPWLGTILHEVTKFADWVEGLDADDRARFAEHTTFADMLGEIGEQVRRALLIVYPVPGLTVTADNEVIDEDAIERVAKRIKAQLDKHGRSTRGAIKQRFSAPDRKHVDPALDILLEMGLIVADADGQIELGQEAAK